MLTQERKVEVIVVAGHIAIIDADALITTINSSGMGIGSVDRAINRFADSMLHDQVGRAKLKDGMAFVTYATGPHNGSFKNVIFVVDDLRLSLRAIIAAGLKAADEAGFKSVTLPTIGLRLAHGCMVETSVQVAIEEIVIGVNTVIEGFRNLESVTFVVDNDPEIETKLASEFVVQHNNLRPRVIVYRWLC